VRVNKNPLPVSISNFDGTPANDYGAWVRTHYLTTFP